MNGKKWKTLSSKIVYKNPFMKIREDEVIKPNGKASPFYVLDRFSPFSIIIPLEDDLKTYLVGQYRYSTKYYSWEFPMGGVINLSPLAIAKQELKEETGFSAKRWERLGKFQVSPGHASQEGFVFLAQDLKEGEPEPEENEFLEVKKMSIKKVGEMIKKGEILDGPTIIAYHLLEQHLELKSDVII